MIIIGGIGIPDEAGFDVSQSYDNLDAKTLLRMKSGLGIMQGRWRKLSSQIAGNGWLPDGLDVLNPFIAVDLACIAPLSVAAALPEITLPRAYRTDIGYAPQGAAIVAARAVPTAAVLAGQVVTLTPVAGASQYHIVYYPLLTGFASVARQFDDANQQTGWTIEFQEQ